MLNYSTLAKHRDQLEAEAISWHVMNGSMTSQNQPAYKAGYEQGFSDALATLKLHADLKIDYTH